MIVSHHSAQALQKPPRHRGDPVIENTNHLCGTQRQPKPISVKGAWHTSVASFAFPSKTGSTDFPATKHPTDVSTLTGQVMCLMWASTRIYPITGQRSLLPSSLPIPPTACLTVSLPKGRRHGVITFRVFDIEYLRPTLSAGGGVARVGRSTIPPNHPLTFWSKPFSSFGLSMFTTVASVHLCWP